MNYKRALTEEAVRLLEISDTPDLYHMIRRWARVHIKHETVAPIDTVNWPKGCLMTGLMHMTYALKDSDNSPDRAVSILAMASVQSYLDRWIKAEAPVYTHDDCLALMNLFVLSDLYKDEDLTLSDLYLRVTDGVMHFLREHDKDAEGALLYRPAQKTGQIFADSVGMVPPFAIRYGLRKSDDDAIELGLRQITCAIKHLTDPETGLPWHVYSIKENGDVETFGALGWGRALGWIMFGLRSSLEAFNEYPPETFMAHEALKTIDGYLKALSDTASSYKRQNGLFGSLLTDDDSPADTSASAMILYGLGEYDITPFIPYIRSSGAVDSAQGECMGIGQYSDVYASFPWSVGMSMMLI